MATVARKAIMKALVEGVLTELMVKTQIDNVYLDDGVTTLSAKIAEMVSGINLRAKSTDVTAEISAAIDALIGGAPNTYDTLKEIADYIADNEGVMPALNAAIGSKVDKVAGKGLSAEDFTSTLKTKLDGIAAGAQVNVIESIKVNGTALPITSKGVNITVPTGALAGKSVVAETDLDAALKAKVNAAAEGNHSHDNKAVLDGITAETVAAWNGKSKVYAQDTQPTGLAAGDLWFQTL
ncbi:MAG TPA: hypothetical protein VN421_05930 [Pseudoflavonifractor sp.]|nr:hypothetical protein [Pseudoflavonifractor sp.]